MVKHFCDICGQELFADNTVDVSFSTQDEENFRKISSELCYDCFDSVTNGLIELGVIKKFEQDSKVF